MTAEDRSQSRKAEPVTLKLFLVVSLSLAASSSAVPAWAEEGGSAGWAEKDRQAKIAYKRGDLTEAREKWQEALKEAEQARQVEPGVVNCLCGLALVADRNGQKAESERLYELAMRNLEGTTGPASPKFAEWMPDLALLYESHGKAAKAEVLYKRALAIDESSFGERDRRVAELLTKYESFLKRQNRLAEAEKIKDRVETIKDEQ